MSEAIENAIREAVILAVEARDRIYLEYLLSRGLINDFEEWVGVLNNDPERMNKLVFGDYDA